MLFRQALLMQRPPWWKFLLGHVFPIHEVFAWRAREDILHVMAIELRAIEPGPKLVARLQAIAGRDWPKLYTELMDRWAEMGEEYHMLETARRK